MFYGFEDWYRSVINPYILLPLITWNNSKFLTGVFPENLTWLSTYCKMSNQPESLNHSNKEISEKEDIKK